MNRNNYLIFLSLLFWGCTSEKDFFIEMPAYENQMVVEAYLEPGENYRITLSESQPFLSDSLPVEVKNATVTIEWQGIIDTLYYEQMIDFSTEKFYNYLSTKVVPFDYQSNFILRIRDGKGREMYGITKIPKPVQINKVEFIFNDNELSYPQITFKDDLSKNNYYRYTATRDKKEGLITDLVVNDELIKSEEIVLGGRYKFGHGDPAILYLYHMTEEYYSFLTSVRESQNANGNPFGQPSKIRSNVQGGIGIFTGLSYDVITTNTPAP